MVVPRKEVLDVLQQHGSVVDFEKKICKFPRTLVEEFVKKSPSRIVLGARNRKNTLTLEKGASPVFMPNIGAKYVNDLETRERREAVLRDVEESNRVIDALDHIHSGGETVHPSDVTPHLAQYHSWIAAFKNTSKNLSFYQPDPNGVKVAMEMAAAVSGDQSGPIILNFVACIPEVLGFEATQLDGMVESFRNRIPLWIESGPASGATGPGTLTGTLVLSNAEILGAITLAQILSPGTPVVYMNYARHFDMKAENVALCGPEFILLRICQAQMANLYNIPSATSGLSSDAKILDIQAGYDKSDALVSVLSGTDCILSDAIDGGDVEDLAELVVNDELAAAYTWVWKGLEVNEDTLAIKEIEKVGPGLGHNFIGTKHTMQHFRKETWLDYKISERRKWEHWKRDGAKSAERKAVERAKEIVKNHQPEPIPKDIEKQFESIMIRASGRTG